MPEKTFFDQVNRIGIAFCGQTANLVPADKKLYALRDVTATVENLSLIAGSIMSKKIAGGADAIVLDVKCGSGAFMKTREDAFALAKEMVKIGNGMGRETSAVISSMEQPLGRAVGNSNEVTEAIETLLGKGPGDLRSLSLEVGARMLVAGKKAKDSAEGKNILEELIRNGKALGKFEELIRAQGGDSSLVTHPENFAKCTHSRDVLATQSGFVASIQAEQIGIAAMILGAGREKKEDIIDHSAGVYLHKKTGDAVQAGDALATFFTNRAEKINEASEKILQAYSLSTNEITPPPLILGFCDRSGIMELR
jgi:pyrimidine-nucleoside phosphorylase